MRSASAQDSYTVREIALAAGVPDADVLAALGYSRALVPHAEAVQLGRMLVQRARTFPAAGLDSTPRASLFGMFSGGARGRRSTGVPLVLSSTLHASLIALGLFLATFDLTPRAASLRPDDRAEPMRLVFLATPGPGGGGGGGGLLQKAPPPAARRGGPKNTHRR